jgi:hypothetical protein
MHDDTLSVINSTQAGTPYKRTVLLPSYACVSGASRACIIGASHFCIACTSCTDSTSTNSS